jgi:sugar-specific transcriptional regulator TrmB
MLCIQSLYKNKFMGKCSYNFNGVRKTGKTPEECAKLAARFDKILKEKQRQMDSLSGRKRKETPKPNEKKNSPSKIKKKATQLITNFKNRRAVAKKRRAVQNSRRRGLDRNTKN